MRAVGADGAMLRLPVDKYLGAVEYPNDDA
jgi:hypothetical protein